MKLSLKPKLGFYLLLKSESKSCLSPFQHGKDDCVHVCRREERLCQSWPDEVGSEFTHQSYPVGRVGGRGERLIIIYLFSNQVAPLHVQIQLGQRLGL